MHTDEEKDNPFHVTILAQAFIGIFDLWNPSTYFSVCPNFSRKA
jgi:hypothetical protein